MYTMTIRNRSSHIKFIHGQIKLIPIHIRLLSSSRSKPLINTLFQLHFRIWDARLILLVIVLLNFYFQKCRDPNPLLDPVGGSKLEPGLLRRFQSKHLFRFIKFFIFKSVATRIPDSTRKANPSKSPVYSDIFNYLLKTFVLSY